MKKPVINFDIATAHSRLARHWRNKKMSWDIFAAKCSQTRRTDEKALAYMRMSKEEQSQIKDVGGFVGGYLRNGIRKKECVLCRTLATLDIDAGTANTWEDFTMAYPCAALMYSTHKHTPEAPRLRLVVPFSRPVTPVEYEPICRRIADAVGIEQFDVSTFQTARLFYWPSTPADGEFFFRQQEGGPLDVDDVLATYTDFRDASEWPVAAREGELLLREMKKAGDPLEKPGLIGAFCRAYTIEEAVDTFLPEAYEATAQEGRYTYKKGSVAGGLVCYEGKFAYSHHETDPAGRRLLNAFDLCRVHLFGVNDEGCRTDDQTKRPSYALMTDFAAKDGRVRGLLLKERQTGAKSDFEGVELPEGDDDTDTGTDPGDEWRKLLEFDKRGNVVSTISNAVTILEHDRKLRGRLWLDKFSGFAMVTGGLPWNPAARVWENSDDANLRTYLERNYGLTGKEKIKDAWEVVLTKNSRHPITDYLDNLKWDGTPRLDVLIIDYLGAEDTPLTRAMTRKQFTAAVARVFRPGIKYDYCLILQGGEGIGKSSLLSIMGGEWFSDSLVTMEGKNGMEQARGGWIIEIGELGGIKKSEVEMVKAFISRCDDIYRPAYGQHVEKHPRQCVFFGTTNEDYFLKGDTGNRRFWVIRCDAAFRKVDNLREAVTRDRDQLWAEATYYYKEGEPLYLSDDLEKLAKERQAEANVEKQNPLADLLDDFLGRRLPVDWATYDLHRRRAYFNNPDPLDAEGTEERVAVTAAEFICERLCVNMSDERYYNLSRRVSRLLKELDGWEGPVISRQVATLYGVQKTYRKKTK